VALRYRSVRGDGRLCGPLFPSHAASGGSTSDLRSGFLGLPHGGGEHDEEAGLRAEGAEARVWPAGMVEEGEVRPPALTTRLDGAKSKMEWARSSLPALRASQH
jgi:hypothetical protein